MKSSSWSRGFTVSLVVGTLLACGTVREDEFICENAVSHSAGVLLRLQRPGRLQLQPGLRGHHLPRDRLRPGRLHPPRVLRCPPPDGRVRASGQPARHGPAGGRREPSHLRGLARDRRRSAGRRRAGRGDRMRERRRLRSGTGLLSPEQQLRGGPGLSVGTLRVRYPGLRHVHECEPGRGCEALDASSSFATFLMECIPVDASGVVANDATSDAPPFAPDATDAESRDDAASSEAGPTSSDASPADARPE